MNHQSPVCMIQAGACTAVGASAAASAAAIRAKVAEFAEHPYMIDKEGEPMIVARATYLPDKLEGIERFIALATLAAQATLKPLNHFSSRIIPIPIIIGLPSPRPGLPEALEKQLKWQLSSIPEVYCRIADIEVIFAGHAAGLMALETGWQRIQQGKIACCLIGGVDCYLIPETLEWLDENEQLHSESNAYGLIPGEAAGFCLLASEQWLQQYHFNNWCRILAVATAQETNLIKTDTVCIGKGLSEAVQQVLLALPAENKVTQTICDMNGEPYRADEYGFTIARTSERFVDATDFLAPADCWGDVGAASGPLFLNLAVAAGLKGYAKGKHTLLWASSESGERAAALIRVDISQRGV